MGLIIASKFYLADHLDETHFLSDYNATIYTNYIQYIYRNNELRNNIIGANQNNNITDSIINCDIALRFMKPNGFQIAIFIWVLGFVWNEFKQIINPGLRVYLKVPSKYNTIFISNKSFLFFAGNYVDALMNILYILYFIFLYSSMICSRLAMNTFYSSDYWNNITRYDTMTDSEKQYYISKTRYVIYWINADRFYWKGADLENLSEAFFAMGTVVSFCRMCFLLPINEFVGPLQVFCSKSQT
jgi:hypothetical protein